MVRDYPPAWACPGGQGHRHHHDGGGLQPQLPGPWGCPIGVAILLAGAIGTWYVGWRVPTREVVIDTRSG